MQEYALDILLSDSTKPKKLCLCFPPLVFNVFMSVVYSSGDKVEPIDFASLKYENTHPLQLTISSTSKISSLIGSLSESSNYMISSSIIYSSSYESKILSSSVFSISSFRIGVSSGVF